MKPVRHAAPDGVDRRLLRRLGRFLAKDELLTSRVDRALYRRDASFLNAEPLAVALPRSVEQLRQVVVECRDAGIPLVPRGAGTGLAGGAVPLGVDRAPLVVSLARMQRIRWIDPVLRRARVQAGVPNSVLDAAARRHGLFLAPDPSSQVACTLGGNASTNAGGAHCLRYGVTTTHVTAVQMIDSDGAVHELGADTGERLGLDLRGLLVGSEGTLGFITEVTFQLLPEPASVETALLSFPTLTAAADAVSRMTEHGVTPTALELMDRGALTLVQDYCDAGYPRDAAAVLLLDMEGSVRDVRDGFQEAVIAAKSEDCFAVRTATSRAEREQLWYGRKSFGGAIAKVVPEYYLHDVVVPRSRLAEAVTRVQECVVSHGLRTMHVHHAGDGNLHPLVLFDRDQPGVLDRVLDAGRGIVEVALDLGGCITGEHGVGLEKRDFFQASLSPAERALHDRIRSAVDPHGLLNPGKVTLSGGACMDVTPSLIPEGAWV